MCALKSAGEKISDGWHRLTQNVQQHSHERYTAASGLRCISDFFSEKVKFNNSQFLSVTLLLLRALHVVVVVSNPTTRAVHAGKILIIAGGGGSLGLCCASSLIGTQNYFRFQ
jgi:FlaA1/EpsC-like NDP-sugar epimerase